MAAKAKAKAPEEPAVPLITTEVVSQSPEVQNAVAIALLAGIPGEDLTTLVKGVMHQTVANVVTRAVVHETLRLIALNPVLTDLVALNGAELLDDNPDN